MKYNGKTFFLQEKCMFFPVEMGENCFQKNEKWLQGSICQLTEDFCSMYRGVQAVFGEFLILLSLFGNLLGGRRLY